MDYFTLEEARALLPECKRRLAEIAEASRRLLAIASMWRAGYEVAGSMAEAKALEARIHDSMGWFGEHGVVVQGVGPDVLDFPALGPDGRLVFLCWREGEDELTHWHELDAGYIGREPLPVTAVRVPSYL